MSFIDSIYNKLVILRKKINKVRKRFWDTVTDYDFLKKCMLLVLPGYLALLIIAVIIAYAAGGTIDAPGTYAIHTRWISDLGSYRFTPAPYLYDIAAILAGILTIPFTLMKSMKYQHCGMVQISL